jgi:hypothetical protein
LKIIEENKMKKKIKFDVKIDIYSNGAGVIIKSKDKTQSKVFEGKNYMKRYTNWIDKICKDVDKMKTNIPNIEEAKTKPVMGGIKF